MFKKKDKRKKDEKVNKNYKDLNSLNNCNELIVSNRKRTDKVINVTLCIILFLLPLITIPRAMFAHSYNIPKYVVLLICGAVLLVCLFIKRKELKLDRIDKTLIAFFILIVISTVFSINIRKSILGENNRFEGFLTLSIYFMTYYCAKYYFNYNKYIKIFAILTVTIASVIGILQYYNIFPFYFLFDIPYFSSTASSTFGHRNFFGSFLSIAVPLFMALYITKKKKGYLIMCFVSFWAMLVSMTRSSWVGLAFATVFGLIYIIKNFNKKILIHTLHIVIGFVVIFVFVLMPPSFISNAINQNEKYYSLEGRLNSVGNDIVNIFSNASEEEIMTVGTARMGIWMATLDSIAQEPLIGTGPDTLKDALFRHSIDYVIYRAENYHEVIDKAHNEYLQIAATIGIPALIVYLAFVAQIILKQKNVFKNDMVFALMVTIISYLAQAFFNISTIGVAPIFWALLGLTQNEKWKVL